MNLVTGGYGLTVTDVVGCTAEFDFFLVSSTEDALAEFTDIRIFPNPAVSGGALNIALMRENNKEKHLLVSILDLYGKTITEQWFVANRNEEIFTLSTEALVAGVFLVQITDRDSGGALVKKVVITPGD
jgi:hypothetical protein